jgi:hypothetical protein
MRYSTIISALSLVFMSHASMAQAPKSSLSFSLGQFLNYPASGEVGYDLLSAARIKQSSRFLPQLSANFEYLMDKELSVGFQFHYLRGKSDMLVTDRSWFNSNLTHHEEAKVNAFGGDINIKYFFQCTDKFATYMNLSGGAFLAQEKVTYPFVPTKSQDIKTKIWIMLNLGVGVRYFPSNKYGFFSELGYMRLGPPHGLHLTAGTIFRY